MKKILLQLTLFIAPIVVIAYPLDVFFSKVLRKDNGHAVGEYSTWSDIYDGKVNSDVVIYGSSRGWVQIDPALISAKLNAPAYNLGIDGYTFWLEYLRHTLLLKNNTSPKLIIQSLDVFTLANSRELYNSDQFLPYMLFDHQIKSTVAGFKGYNHYDFELPLVRYYGKTEAITSAFRVLVKPGTNVVKRVRGYEGQDLVWGDDFSKAKEKLKYFESKIDTPTLHLFEHFLNECKAKNIKVVLVYTPEYIEGQKFTRNRAAIMALYKKLSEQYSVPFFDYSTDTISYQKKYFYNAEHLNKIGSELFTNKLIKDIENK